MGDLLYATIVIVIIWGGIFFYLLSLDRRVRSLEGMGTGAASEEAGSRIVTGPGTPAASAGPQAPAEPAETTGGGEDAGEEAAIE